MYSIILCGGSGTRLWPLSRKNFPKQFLKLYSDYSLLQETFLRMKDVVSQENIYFVTNDENYYNVLNQIKEVYADFSENQILREPKSLNTMPAITLAVKYLQEKIGIDEMAPIIMVPADHYIGDKQEYVKVAKNALSEIGGNIGTIGIKPTKAHTGLGYIKKGEKLSAGYKVDGFKEKPDEKTAQEFFVSGSYLWNAGMYIFNAKTFSEETQKHSPEIFSLFEKGYDAFLKDFQILPAIAIDYAISEKSDKMVTFEGDFDWSDVGSFDVLAEILGKKKEDNPRHVSVGSKNIFSLSTNNDKLIVVSGLEDVIVIENNDSILVQKMGDSNNGVKKVVEYLKEKNYQELSDEIIGYRPWGKYEVLIDEDNHKVKKITVYPGASLSLQSHEHRSEHWVVVIGTAKVVNGENLLTLHENESTYIPAKAKHQLANPGKVNLEIIEVQTGDYLGENDITRYEDAYGRKTGIAA
ncbi:MAG: Mannose-1-phosphate guanylyltransferase / phosphomannose isomerase [Candidatus Moranbacteria bacterium GW2011_GWC2_37_73]|nr:MAG: mannose-1-phosphate guanylyltransferase/mannose-6-phosphate isomerase, mannose-1-phosphate guanylyltransferase, mannose-6-phosphate isomerase [Parcubacteria group bacterium GW2011_GWC1_36_108]KKP99925.1 MAG: Mannose-1-phosphate guanylyltransferase / phosphomannose isomerase [Candidatus Moranbacteria bacterium GW2011_GWD1_36_198]KKQ00280.1 MAG: Mannose-1-phosphate guanylyltransferase / phosphomannose isomerase [Candidatus Moranbacteria bacterium GW2011_GWD2_36_198]KKQ39143.1 MAG: Mannose-